MRRVTPLVLGVALLAGAASWAHAAGEVSGFVQSIDSTGRIITFTDGRTVVLESGSRALVNGQEVALQSIRPGTNVVIVQAPAAQPAGASMQHGMMPPHGTVTSHPPIETSGVVSHVDQYSGVITFQDGRRVQALSGRAQIWEPSTMSAVRPGARILVQGAEPLASGAGSSSWRSSANHVTGNVARVDRSTSTIVLDDGTVIHVKPTARVHDVGGQQRAFTDLRPGSVVVVQVQPYDPAPAGVTVQPGVTDTIGVSALPRQAFGQLAFSADDILIVRQPQAP